jgi:hypothetical protein
MSDGYGSLAEHGGQVAKQGAHGLLSVTNVAGVAAEEGGELTSAGIRDVGRVGRSGSKAVGDTFESGGRLYGTGLKTTEGVAEEGGAALVESSKALGSGARLLSGTAEHGSKEGVAAFGSGARLVSTGAAVEILGTATKGLSASVAGLGEAGALGGTALMDNIRNAAAAKRQNDAALAKAINDEDVVKINILTARQKELTKKEKYLHRAMQVYNAAKFNQQRQTHLAEQKQGNITFHDRRSDIANKRMPLCYGILQMRQAILEHHEYDDKKDTEIDAIRDSGKGWKSHVNTEARMLNFCKQLSRCYVKGQLFYGCTGRQGVQDAFKSMLAPLKKYCDSAIDGESDTKVRLRELIEAWESLHLQTLDQPNMGAAAPSVLGAPAAGGGRRKYKRKRATKRRRGAKRKSKRKSGYITNRSMAELFNKKRNKSHRVRPRRRLTLKDVRNACKRQCSRKRGMEFKKCYQECFRE